MDLKSARIVITGASKGLGKCLAQSLQRVVRDLCWEILMSGLKGNG
jgi:short-subunit dehydrogenase